MTGPAANGFVERVRRTTYLARAVPIRRLGAVLLVLAISVSGGAAIAGAIGARRAQHSVSRFLQQTATENADSFAEGSQKQAAAALLRLGHLPGVTRARRMSLIVVGLHLPGGRRVAMVAENDIDPLSATRPLATPHVLDGRLPDPGRADEVAINQTVADLLHVIVGDVIPLSLYTAAQIDEVGGGREPKPLGGTVRMHVVSIVRRPGDLEKAGEAAEGINTAADGYLYATPAFWRSAGSGLASYVTASFLHLTVPVAKLRREAQRAHLPVEIEGGNNALKDPASVRRSTHIESGALWVLVGLITLVSVALLGPALRRWVAVRAADEESLVAVGSTRRSLAGVEVIRAAPVLFFGALGAVILGAGFGPFAAFGTSRLAELTRPVQWPFALLGLGGGVVFVTGMAIVLVGRFLASRTRNTDRSAVGDVNRGAGRLLNRIALAGAPPSLTVGALLALPARRRNGTTIRSAVGTVAVGVALLIAALTFSANLTHLVGTPKLRGWSWDYEVGNYSQKQAVSAGAASLRSDPDVGAFTGFNDGNFQAGGHPLDVAGIERVGMARLPTFSGRLPKRAGEIALATRTLAALHLHLGDRVTVVGAQSRSLLIVGTTLGPGAVSEELELSHGGIVQFADLPRLQPGLVASSFLVRFKPGVDHVHATQRLRTLFPNTVVAPFDTPEITTLRRAESLPLVLAGMVGVLAFGTLVYAVAGALRHRRREVALLKALGFDRNQLRVASVVQAELLALVAVVIGIPIGLIVGRGIWVVAARTVGVVVSPVLPWDEAFGIALAALAVALGVGAAASRAVTRVPAASTLRPE